MKHVLKRPFLIVILFPLSLTVCSQQKVKKINCTILDVSFNIDDSYFLNNSDEYQGNYEDMSPLSIGANIGFEYPVNKYLGLESGLRISYYIKKVEERGMPQNQKRNIDGMYWGPYFSPKIYLALFQDDGGLYIENRFSLAHSITNIPSGNIRQGYGKMIFLYDLSLGIHFEMSDRTCLNLMAGYNGFNLSKIKTFEDDIKKKSRTPLHIGMGVSFVL